LVKGKGTAVPITAEVATSTDKIKVTGIFSSRNPSAAATLYSVSYYSLIEMPCKSRLQALFTITPEFQSELNDFQSGQTLRNDVSEDQTDLSFIPAGGLFFN
jgi:hypothetical protein